MIRKRKIHPFPPVFDQDAEILILGTFPSVKSRENRFYYGHPQNRFWPVLSYVFDDVCPVSPNDSKDKDIEEKKAFLRKHHIALWDVLSACEIENSADSTIQNPAVNDIAPLLKKTKIKRVFCNGKKAQTLYDQYLKKQTDITAVYLPSTSPANASYTLPKLIEAWQVIVP